MANNTNNRSDQRKPKESSSNVDDPLSMFLIDAEPGATTTNGGAGAGGDESEDALRMAEDMMNSIVQDMGDDLGDIDLNSGENDGTTTNNLEDINIDSFLDVEEDDQHDAVVVVNSTSSSNATTSDVKADGSGMNKAMAARCIDDDAMMFHSSELDDLENDEANQSEIDLNGGDDTQETGGVEGNSNSMNGDGNESSIGVDHDSSPHVVKLPPPSPTKGQKGMGHSLKKKAAKMATSFCSPSRSSSHGNKEGTVATNSVVEDPLWNTGSSPLRPGMDTTETARTSGTSGRSSAAVRSHPFSSSSSAAVGQHDHPLGGVSSSSSSNPLESIKKAGSSAFSQATTASSSTFGSLFQKAAANISSFTASADAALSSVVTHQPHSSSAPTTMSHSSSPDSEDMQHSSGGGHDGISSSSRRTMMMMDDNFQLLQNPAIQSQLLTMALGGSNSKPLHQGERIILFLPHVVNVATSSSPVSGVASSATIVAATGSSNNGSSALSSQQLWAMCITFYRIILFNYTLSQVEQLMGTAPGCVTSDAASVASGKPSSGGSKTDGGSTEESGDDQQSSPSSSAAVASGSSSSGCSMSTAARQGLDNAILRAGLSRQWQYHHAPHQHDKRGGDDNDDEAVDSAAASSLPFKHFVLQIPLGAIDRVEKGDVPYSMASNSTVLSNSMNFASSAGRAGSSSNVNGMNSHSQQSGGGGSRSQSNNHLGSESHRTSSDGMMMNGSNNTTTTAATPMTTAQQTIVLYDKGGSNRWIRFTSVNLADAIRAHEALSTYAFPGKRNLGYLFAFEACREQVLALNQGSSSTATQPAPSVGDSSKSEPSNSINNKALPNNSRYKPLKEFARMGITAAGGGTNSNMVGRYAQPQPWTITHANVNYHLCSSYPSILVVPTCASPEVSGDAGRRLLTQCASFRSERRLPVLAWGNGTDAASIWRCSQPKVGLGGNRNSGDEAYLKALSETAGRYIKHSTMKLPPAYTRLLTGANDAESDVLSFLKVQIKAVTLSSAGVSSSSSSRTGSNDKRSPQGSSASKSSHVRISSSGGGSSKSGSPTGYNKNDNSYATSNTTTTVPLGLPPLKIMDLRPKSAAMANRTQGYGYESSSNYPQGQVSFYNIANIHGVRDSLGKLSSLAMNPVTQDINFSGLVESTGWLTLIRTILNASWQCAAIVNFHRLPVLLHCSHGWDRTSQVSALAQLMLDSYYRTMKGFAVLVEKEFGSFGHPFHLRCGHGEGSAGDFYTGSGGQSTTGTGQRSPIFLQFIDCVWQLVNQFPTFFEFNTRYLLVICDHIYSCRFGTFLCDNERERIAAGIYERTQSLWDYLDDIEESTRRGTTTTTTIFTNPFYNSMTNLLIPPLPCLLRQVTLWSDYHLRYSPRAYLTCLPIDLVPYVVPSSSTSGTVLETTTKEGDAQEEKASDKEKLQASSFLPNELTTLFCSRDEQDATLHKLAEELTRMKRLCQQQESEIAKLKQQGK